MKRIFSVMACIAVLLSLAVPAFATGETVAEPIPDTVTDSPPGESAADPEEIATGEESPSYIFEEDEFYVSVNLEDSDREWSAESIPGILVELFGEYTPRTQTVTEYHSDGSEVTYEQIVPGLAGLDWLWIASVGVFSLFMFCVLRALGGCLKWI